MIPPKEITGTLLKITDEHVFVILWEEKNLTLEVPERDIWQPYYDELPNIKVGDTIHWLLDGWWWDRIFDREGNLRDV